MSEDAVGYSWEEIFQAFGDSDSLSLIAQHILGVKFAITFKLIKAKEMREITAEISKHELASDTPKYKLAYRAKILLKKLDNAIGRLDGFNDKVTELAESMVFDAVNAVRFYKRFTRLTAKILKVIDQLNIYMEAARALKTFYDSMFSKENKEEDEG